MYSLSVSSLSRGIRSSNSAMIARTFRCFSVAASETKTDAAATAPAKRRHTREEIAALLPKEPQNIYDAIDLAKKFCWASFDESIDIVINTGLDPRKPNQNVKGMAKLPSGRGKKVRICVIAQAEDADKAKQAGADVAGSDEVIAMIQQGDVNFNTVIATPEMMSQVGKIGKILGPRGLMPNPKVGTVTKDVVKAVQEAKAGAVQFKTDRQGVVHAGLGKASFSDAALLENIRSFMVSLANVKPEGFKGKFMLTAFLQSTMGPSIPLDVASVDPSSPRFMLNLKGTTK